ncbi:MAG: nucleotidyltransferase domain-containing protein [Spirochaetes bacterium]|nr:nucleotidyltransferase domain-containing protein [Spirochaetota bacterium]
MDYQDRPGTGQELPIESIISVLSAVPDIRFAVLFGSQARGDSHPLSDLDIGIYFDNLPKLLELGGIISQLEAASGMKTDVVELQGLAANDPLLSYNIMSDAVPLLENRANALSDYKALVWSCYFDAADFLARGRAAMAERVEHNQFGRMQHA